MGDTSITNYTYKAANGNEITISRESLNNKYNDKLELFVEQHKTGDKPTQDIINAAYDYVISTLCTRDGYILNEKGEKIKEGTVDGKVNFEEWAIATTYKYMGMDPNSKEDQDAMKKIFDNADLNGDGGLDEEELLTMYFYKDATTKGKDGEKIGNDFKFDGVINMEEGTKDLARNVRFLEDDKEGFRALSNGLFGRTYNSYIDQYMQYLANGEEDDPSTATFAMPRIFEGANTEEEYVEAAKAIASQEIEASDGADGKGETDGKLTKDEYVEGKLKAFEQYRYQYIDGEGKEDPLYQQAVGRLRTIFEIQFTQIDTNQNGFLEMNELAASYIAQDMNDQGAVPTPNAINVKSGGLTYEMDGVVDFNDVKYLTYEDVAGLQYRFGLVDEANPPV